MNRKPTETYQLGQCSSESSNAPFSLLKRMPAWYPDGVPTAQGQVQRLFPQEFVGGDGDGPIAWQPPLGKDPVTSHKWILGTTMPSAAGTDPAGLISFMQELARRARSYNASLYRLRRLHFASNYPSQPKRWPKRNPHGDPKEQLNPGSFRFKQLAKEAEQDWQTVNDSLNELIEDASNGIYMNLKLIGADVILSNNYIVSMRVAVQKSSSAAEEATPMDIGPSSSQYSLDSAFSSYSST